MQMKDFPDAVRRVQGTTGCAAEAPFPGAGPARSHPIEKETVLDEAKRLVGGDRGAAYGHPSDAYAPVGRIWGAILKIPDIPPATVCLMLSAMKIGRHSVRPKRDNLVDVAGYARTVEMCEERGTVPTAEQASAAASVPAIDPDFYRGLYSQIPRQHITATVVQARIEEQQSRPFYGPSIGSILRTSAEEPDPILPPVPVLVTEFSQAKTIEAVQANPRLHDGLGLIATRAWRVVSPQGRVIYVVLSAKVREMASFALGCAVLQPGDIEDSPVGLRIAAGQALKNIHRKKWAGLRWKDGRGPRELTLLTLVPLFAKMALRRADARKATE